MPAHSEPADGRAVGASWRAPALGLAAWAALIAITFAVGAAFHPGYPGGQGWLPPMHATLRQPARWIVSPLIIGLAAVWLVPRWFERLSWRPLLLVAFGVTAIWAVLLAASDGWRQLTSPIASKYDYLPAVPTVGSDPIGWLGRFTELVPTLPTHPSAHPPLTVLILWTLDQVGLGSAGVAAAVCIVAGASAVPAVLITTRILGGEDVARRAAPFLALAPFVLTVATCFDALFAGVAAWGVAVLAMAVERRSAALGALAGVLLVSVLYLNYGLVVVGALALAVVALRWRPRVVVAAVVGGLVVVALFTAAGFWWFDGIAATHKVWAASHGGNRPYVFTIFGNLAVYAILVGPATAVAATRVRAVRERALVALGGAALVAVLALDIAGITRGEVERIWLPLAPWAVVVTAALPSRWVRPALVAQVLTAVAVQAFLGLRW